MAFQLYDRSALEDPEMYGTMPNPEQAAPVSALGPPSPPIPHPDADEPPPPPPVRPQGHGLAYFFTGDPRYSSQYKYEQDLESYNREIRKKGAKKALNAIALDEFNSTPKDPAAVEMANGLSALNTASAGSKKPTSVATIKETEGVVAPKTSKSTPSALAEQKSPNEAMRDFSMGLGDDSEKQEFAGLMNQYKMLTTNALETYAQTGDPKDYENYQTLSTGFWNFMRGRYSAEEKQLNRLEELLRRHEYRINEIRTSGEEKRSFLRTAGGERRSSAPDRTPEQIQNDINSAIKEKDDLNMGADDYEERYAFLTQRIDKLRSDLDAARQGAPINDGTGPAAKGPPKLGKKPAPNGVEERKNSRTGEVQRWDGTKYVTVSKK